MTGTNSHQYKKMSCSVIPVFLATHANKRPNIPVYTQYQTQKTFILILRPGGKKKKGYAINARWLVSFRCKGNFLIRRTEWRTKSHLVAEEVRTPSGWSRLRSECALVGNRSFLVVLAFCCSAWGKRRIRCQGLNQREKKSFKTLNCKKRCCGVDKKGRTGWGKKQNKHI